MISERLFARSFNWFWNELLPLLTPRFISLFNQAYERELFDNFGRALIRLPLPSEVRRPDIVAEFAFRLARFQQQQGLSPLKAGEDREALKSAELLAFELIQKYEGKQPTSPAPLTDAELQEGLLLCARYDALYRVFPMGSEIEYCPTFLGAGFINSGEGDIGIADCLIEVKTTTRKPSGRDLRQLFVYMALDANSELSRWRYVGIFNPRNGTLHLAEVAPLILRLSGGTPKSDIFAELIAFAESNDPRIDRKF